MEMAGGLSHVTVLHRRSITACLSHHAGNAAGPPPRRLDRVFQITMRGCHAVARPPIGPGPAAVLPLAGVGACLALGIRRRLKRAKVTTGAVDGILARADPWLDDAGAPYPRDTASRLDRRYDILLQPAHRRSAGRRRIGEAPGPAAVVALATRRADRRIAVWHGRAGEISARPVITGLRQNRRCRRERRDHCQCNAEDDCAHRAAFAAWNMIRKKPALGLDPRVPSGFPPSRS